MRAPEAGGMEDVRYRVQCLVLRRQAKIFQDQGFQWLHCVDLNGAFAGKSANAQAIKAIRAAITLPIQLGGGIRDLAAVEHWLAAGITRIILGTAALTDPEFVTAAPANFPGRSWWGPTPRAARSQPRAGRKFPISPPSKLGMRFEDAGLVATPPTDIDGDGLAQWGQKNGDRRPGLGPLHSGDRLGGGLHRRYRRPGKRPGLPNIEGSVVGRALYDGRIDPRGGFGLEPAQTLPG